MVCRHPLPHALHPRDDPVDDHAHPNDSRRAGEKRRSDFGFRRSGNSLIASRQSLFPPNSEPRAPNSEPLPMRAPRPAAGAAFSALQVFDRSADVLFSRLGFLHGNRPANPFIPCQRRNVLPRRQRPRRCVKSVTQIARQLVWEWGILWHDGSRFDHSILPNAIRELEGDCPRSPRAPNALLRHPRDSAGEDARPSSFAPGWDMSPRCGLGRGLVVINQSPNTRAPSRSTSLRSQSTRTNSCHAAAFFFAVFSIRSRALASVHQMQFETATGESIGLRSSLKFFARSCSDQNHKRNTCQQHQQSADNEYQGCVRNQKGLFASLYPDSVRIDERFPANQTRDQQRRKS